jgi:hypothetical protein
MPRFDRDMRKALLRSPALLWEVPLSVLSFTGYRIVKHVTRGLRSAMARIDPEHGLRWRPLTSEMFDDWLGVIEMSTLGPRWNPHAVIAGLGPISVTRSIALDLETLWRTSDIWAALVHEFPSYRTVGVISSRTASREAAWHEQSLPPGRYVTALRYYHPRAELWLPAVRVDGREVTPRRPIRDDPDAFYRQLAGHGNAFYRALHYYVLTMLRHREALPPALIQREFAPIGNPETHFCYDLLRAGQVFSLEVPEPLLGERDVFLVIYGRDSFPRFWCQVDGTRFEAPPAPCDGFYLVRVHPRRAGLPPLDANLLTIRIDDRAHAGR